MKLIDYREKLGIAFCDEEKIEIFLAKAYMALSETIQMDIELTTSQYNDYCFNAGIKAVPEYYGQYADNSPIVFAHLQKATDDFKKFIYYYSVFLNALAKNPDTQKRWIDAFNHWASQSGLQFDFLQENDNYFIFPKGAKELDDALVSEPLEWLKAYPQTRKEWIDALKDYSNLDSNNASDVADKFRKVLERFFQEFFNTTKTLENLKSEYGNYMKSKGVPPEISNNLETLQQCYTNFMNNYAKHHDKTSENLLEYIMYQTGNIIRLIITLK